MSYKKIKSCLCKAFINLLVILVLTSCSHNKNLEVKPNIIPQNTEDIADTTEEDENSSDGDIDTQDNENEDEYFEDLFGKEIDYEKMDPLEKINRVLYQVHRGLDLLLIRPIAITYDKMPKPIKRGLYNFVSNLAAPLRAVCWLLQGQGKEACKTINKFAINTILGVGGVFDVSEKIGFDDSKTSFAQTLKKWGIETGPYIVVPGLGPSTMRTAFGFLFDSFLDPVFLLTLNKNLPYNKEHALLYSETAAQLTSVLISRSKIEPVYEDIEKTKINRYHKLRGLVLMQDINQ